MNRGERLLEEVHHRVIIGDGAIGTMLFARGVEPGQGVELMNLRAPDLVRGVHQEYIAAGSRLIETNTFGANRLRLARYGCEAAVGEIVRAGARIAREAAGEDVYVAGAMGPLPLVESEPVASQLRTALYAEQITALLEGGVDVLLFESFADLAELCAAITVARSMTTAPIIAQMAFEASGAAPDGNTAETMAAACLAAGANLVGANCGFGVPSVIRAITRMATCGVPMSAFMNAGFPEQVEGRQCFLATPEYLARRALELVSLGVRLVGGCCGTDPDTVRAIALALSQSAAAELTRRPAQPVTVDPPSQEEPASPLLTTAFPLLVELDPPGNADIAPVLEAAHALREAGATVITVADNPLASARLDPVTLAGCIQREVGLSTLPHLTGRDRNRLALLSTIMAAHAQGIRALLGITGDPIRLCNEPSTSGVFDVNSISLVRLIAECNAGLRLRDGQRTAFAIGVALNPNVRTLSGQIEKLGRKVAAGAQFALTQPLFEMERLMILQEALAAAEIRIPIFIGVLPLVSSRNADFLHNEVPGILIPDAIRERLARYSAPADQRAAGIEIAVELAQQFAPHVDGLYAITPRNRVEMVLPVLEAAQAAAV